MRTIVDSKISRQALNLAFDGLLHVSSPMWKAQVPYAGKMTLVAHVAALSSAFPADDIPKEIWELRDPEEEPVWKIWIHSRILRWPPPSQLDLTMKDKDGWTVAHYWVARRAPIPQNMLDSVMTIKGPLGIPVAHSAAPHASFYPLRRYLLLRDDYGITTAHILARLGTIVDPMPWDAVSEDRLSVAEIFALNNPPCPGLPDVLPMRADIVSISPYADAWRSRRKEQHP